MAISPQAMPARVSLIDCSGNPNYPAAIAGDWYTVSVAGLIGGASGEPVAIGDRIVCITGNIGGTQASVGSSWKVVSATIAGDLTLAKEEAHTISVTTTTTAATAGGALTITAGAGATSGTGGAAALRGGAGGATGTGGAASVTAGAGGSTSGAGGAATITGGAGTAGNSNGGAAGLVGGAGVGTGNGGNGSFTGGVSGSGATGNGGNVSITGGSVDSTNGNGGSVVLVPAAAAGTGLPGGIILRKNPLIKSTATAMTDTATMTAAGIASGLIAGTPTAAANYTMPTGAVLEAGLPSSIATGDSVEWSIVNLATNDTFDITVVTAASGITLKFSNVLVEANSATTKLNWGRFRAVRTGTETYDVYRVG
jgi:hypothetical protein